MICLRCKTKNHTDCKNGKGEESVTRTWCDCQHVDVPEGQILSLEGKGIQSRERIGDLGNGHQESTRETD